MRECANAVTLSSFSSVEEDRIMAPTLLVCQLLLVALVLICLIVHVWWPDEPPRAPKASLDPNKRRHKRSKGHCQQVDNALQSFPTMWKPRPHTPSTTFFFPK
jgi:hypothetical protein